MFPDDRIDNLLDKFLVYLRVELDLSKNTVSGYHSDILHFINFLEKKGLDLLSLSPQSIKSYLKYLNETKIKRTSFLRKMSALNKLYSFLVSTKQLQTNPMLKIERPKHHVSIPRFLTDKEVDAFLVWLEKNNSKNSCRDYLIIELMYASGVRVSEVISVKLSVALDLLRAYKDNKPSMMLVLGKGRKERMVPVRKKTVNALRNFTAKFYHSKNFVSKDAFLFPSRSRLGHITREQVCMLLKKRALEFGLNPERVSPHVMRHSFATNMCKNNVNLRLLQQLLGHSSISTTEIYLHNATNEVLDFVKQNHPFANGDSAIK